MSALIGVRLNFFASDSISSCVNDDDSPKSVKNDDDDDGMRVGVVGIGVLGDWDGADEDPSAAI
jgi:hypothetical protein